MLSNIDSETSSGNSLAFIKELAKYYMDFLETDFRSRKIPKRSIQYRNNKNLLIGINLNKYDSFNRIIWELINNTFDENILQSIRKGQYKTTVPKNLMYLINFHLENLNEEQLANLINLLIKEIEKISNTNVNDYEDAITKAQINLPKIIKTNLVIPFIKKVEKALDNLNINNINSVYLMEEELTSILYSLIKNKVSEILKLLLSKKNIDIFTELKNVFGVDDIKTSILAFFDKFQIGDLFDEIYEMERNKMILDKQEFYLYFCDITFNKDKFPIFYIPFSVEIHRDTLNLEFESQVYVNKKAFEYITQEYNKEKNKKGSLKTITERIIYLAEHNDKFKDLINDILIEVTNFFELDKFIDLNNSEYQVAKSFLVTVSNNCYFSLFDKSDEALVNDYEEILKLLSSIDNKYKDLSNLESKLSNYENQNVTSFATKLIQAFNKLINDFIHTDPISFNPVVEEEWDKKSIVDKLIFNSPIPLNSEQIQILMALRKNDCKYIVIEGPPGTGKSHTITAIICDCVLKNQSVLILSDKKEALDVVEDKITEAMNKVRYGKEFQNPILRVGKTKSTYNQILSTESIENIKNHFRVVNKFYNNVEEAIEKFTNNLKQNIEQEIQNYENLTLDEIQEFINLEYYYQDKELPIDINEFLSDTESVVEFEEIRKILLSLRNKLIIDPNIKENDLYLFEIINCKLDEFKEISAFQEYLKFLKALSENITKLRETFGTDLNFILKLENINDNNLDSFKTFVENYEKEKHWLFGYFFKKKKIENLNVDFRNTFKASILYEPHKNLAELKHIFKILTFSLELKERIISQKFKYSIDYLKFVHQSIKEETVLILIEDLQQLQDDLSFLNINLLKYPNSIKKLNIDIFNFKTLCDNKLTDISDEDFDRLIRYIVLKQKIYNTLNNIPVINYYSDEKKIIEDLTTVQMTYTIDGRLIDFYENNKSTARALRDIIRAKQRFPKNEFIKLKEAFPCIISSIRDYAEYIPFDPEIFDLLIIDEASQVSIAQAFPAILRAKKVLILGDKKQFSNVKTSLARSDINREKFNNLKNCFIKNISNESTKLIKLEKFNIKTSVLDFFDFICNYKTQLLKHFRGYKELISYSNKHFYKNNLQVMKIRVKPINEIIKFTFLEYGNQTEKILNTNTKEADFIIQELKKLKDLNSKQSVGIITPHTNQQKYLIEKINNMEEKDYFYENLKLKIMTFDTCQGEERDIIFYSMVATENNDRLWGVFIKTLEDKDREDNQIKVQRLNVGFSRAKECMHFVLSKDINKFTGAIGNALRYFYMLLKEYEHETFVSGIDDNLVINNDLVNWFYNTNFWQNNKQNIIFIPNFKLYEYLKQLDTNYKQLNFKHYFLLIYNANNKQYKIIIEYDNFVGQILDHSNENFLLNNYYKTQYDVYNEKILESYGYKFLKINKFNIDYDDPVGSLDDKINALIKNNNTTNSDNLLQYIQLTINSIQIGIIKECSKCGRFLNIDDFKDYNLKTGVGKLCKFCKNNNIDKEDEDLSDSLLHEVICPKCNSNMILRNGRYGKFYGCSKFPYCRATKAIER